MHHGLVLKKTKRMIKFNQKPSLKPYFNMNTQQRTKAKEWAWEGSLKVNE